MNEETLATITPAWVREQIADFNIRSVRRLATESGVNYQALINFLAGRLPEWELNRKLLYWYFMYRNVVRKHEER